MAEALMKYETIDAAQIDDIMDGKDVRPPSGWDDNDEDGGSSVKKEEIQKKKEDDDAPSSAPPAKPA